MKTKIKSVFNVFLFIVVCSVVSSCTKKSDSAISSGTASTTSAAVLCDTVNMKGYVDKDTTWKDGKVYVVTGDITLKAVLTIDPGVIVKFKAGADIVFAVSTGGRLIANGTASKHIIFTSFADDSKCGDNNNDGTATNPKNGDWERISITNSSSGNVLNYCDFFYAGYKYNNALSFWNGGGTAVISNCTFAHTKTGDDKFDFALSCDQLDLNSTIENCIFYDNGKPLSIPANFNLSESNTFHNPANSSEINKCNGIYVSDYKSLHDFQFVIAETEVPTVITSVQVNGKSTFTLNSGTVLKVKDGGSITYNTNGSSPLKVNSGGKITSYEDDANGGDTNGDGTLTSPVKGDWKGVDNTISSGGWISAAYILYAQYP